MKNCQQMIVQNLNTHWEASEQWSIPHRGLMCRLKLTPWELRKPPIRVNVLNERAGPSLMFYAIRTGILATITLSKDFMSLHKDEISLCTSAVSPATGKATTSGFFATSVDSSGKIINFMSEQSALMTDVASGPVSTVVTACEQS